MKTLVCISGASGAGLGLKLHRELEKTMESYLVISDSAKKVLACEEGLSDSAIEAPPSSGSFGVDITFVVPCSMNTLAKIAHGIADTLTTRVAAVAIKEKRKLLLAPREMPLSTIALENMLKLSQNGAIIAPPMMTYYSGQQTLEEMENFILGRWLDLAGIENSLYKRWGDE